MTLMLVLLKHNFNKTFCTKKFWTSFVNIKDIREMVLVLINNISRIEQEVGR